MRTSLSLVLLALSLTTATAQTALLTSNEPSTGTAATPQRPEARDAISQVVVAELQTPAMLKQGARLVYVDVKGEAATARVDYEKCHPAKSVYFHLREQNGQWVVTSRDGYATVKL